MFKWSIASCGHMVLGERETLPLAYSTILSFLITGSINFCHNSQTIHPKTKCNRSEFLDSTSPLQKDWSLFFRCLCHKFFAISAFCRKASQLGLWRPMRLLH
ncbi:hypothetical protein Mapa_010813 [Marchantia paleacea]|nr:hypothetical protein Mapa_010813 [Marchantia paleacea]